MAKKFVCGWCQTGHFDQCIKEVKYFDRSWVCASDEYKTELKKKMKKAKTK